MTDGEIVQIALEAGKKGSAMISTLNCLLNNGTWPEYGTTINQLKHKIQDILQLFPEQNMREYMLEICIKQLCNTIDMHAEALKNILTHDLQNINCAVEETQTAEAE